MKEQMLSDLLLIAGIVVIVLIVAMLVKLLLRLRRFASELKYINGEIHRNHGSAKKHWQHKRTRLWLSLIPFVRFR